MAILSLLRKGKGFDDGVYMTSALLRKFLPRGYTNFRFTKDGESENVVLRGFFKFTGGWQMDGLRLLLLPKGNSD